MDKETLLKLVTPVLIFALAIGTLPMMVSAYDQT